MQCSVLVLVWVAISLPIGLVLGKKLNELQKHYPKVKMD